MAMTAWVTPHFDPTYYWFYLEGLRAQGHDLRAGEPVATDFAETLKVEVSDTDGPIRLCFNARDRADLDLAALRWCDAYGIVNFDPALVPAEYRHKVIALGPNFGVRPSSYRAARPLVRNEVRLAPSFRARLGVVRGYAHLHRRRLQIEHYQPRPSRDDFVFHVSWTWKKHQEVNEARARFVDACRSLDGLTFEGGLAPRRRHDVRGFERVTARKRYRLREYLEKQGESLCAFNSPAVHDCLGWKLGEYLALGKAIVSLPLTRELPSPLEHGTHVHIVEDSCEAMAEAVKRLRVDVAYRSELERNSRSYWNRWLAPDQVVGRMMGTARTNRSART